MIKNFFVVFLFFFTAIVNAKEVSIAQIQNNTYAVKLGVFKHSKSFQRYLNKFKDLDVYVSERESKWGKRYHLFIVNLDTKQNADKTLLEVKKSIKDAFIVIKSFDKPTTQKRDIRPEPISKPAPLVSSIENNTTNLEKQTHGEEKEINTTSDISLALEKIQEANVTMDLNQSVIETNTTVAVPTPAIQPNLSVVSGLQLKDAIIKSLERSNKIQSARQKVIQAKHKLDEKRAGYRPKVDLYVNGGGTYHHIKGESGNEQRYPNGSAELLVTQNIYAGGKVSSDFAKEEANLAAAVAKFRSTVEEETTNVIEAYLGIIYEKKSIDINRENMTNLQEILKIVTIKEQNGASTKGDLNYIKSNVENAMTALVKSESKYQNAVSYYEYFVGILDDQTRPIQEDFDIDIASKEATLEAMYKSNAKIAMTKAQILAQQYDVDAKRAPFKPKLDLLLNAKEISTKSETDPLEDKASAMLSMSYNLYNGGKDSAALLGAKSKVAELRYKLTDLEESTKFNTMQMYENMISSQDALSHTQKEVDANKKVTESYWNAFKYGEQDIQALLLAQRALNRSELDAINEQKTYIVGYFKLLAQTGELLNKTETDAFVDPKKMHE